VDPAADAAPGYRADQRGRPGGFAADPDVMDTWATSSLTPQIAGGWPADTDLMQRVFPMDLRPQAHEIIRTWLFYTLLRSQTEAGVLPWQHAAISGWILDPDRKKMSKSKGNAVTPMDLLREHGSDAVRYWAASARLGADTAFDVAQIKIGRRLAIKILNATRFVLGIGAESAMGTAEITEPIDRAMLRRLAGVVAQCTAALEGYEHASALEQTERFFWFFCDDYLELVKARAYGEHGEAGIASARAALRLGLSVLLRLFAPLLPFVTEEAWSWWQDSSVHGSPWPHAAELSDVAGPGDDAVLITAAAAIGAVRKAKSAAGLKIKDPVRLLIVTASHDALDALAAAAADVQAAGKVGAVELRHAAERADPEHQVILT
jgi:valyl-tRNA synthetase